MLATNSKLRNSIDNTVVGPSDGVHPSLVLPEQEFYSYTKAESEVIDNAVAELIKTHTDAYTAFDANDFIVNLRGNYPYILTRINEHWFLTAKKICDDIHPDLVFKYFKKVVALYR